MPQLQTQSFQAAPSRRRARSMPIEAIKRSGAAAQKRAAPTTAIALLLRARLLDNPKHWAEYQAQTASNNIGLETS